MHNTKAVSISSLAALLVSLSVVVAGAQAPLSLDEAISRGLAQHPTIASARAGIQESSARTRQARSGWFPRVEFTEAWQRGNQPVFVFGSLLAQRQFTQDDFRLDKLNHPDAVGNFRAAVTIEQVLFDGLRTPSATKSAAIGRDLAAIALRDAESGIRLGVTRAYGQVLMAEAQRRAAASAVTSADEDLRRVERRRDAGMATEADVLALQVHRAQVAERMIRAESQESIARAQLNEAMGGDLDQVFTLQLPLAAAATEPAITDLEREALEVRPDVLRASAQERLAREAVTMSRAGFLPMAAVQGSFEGNGSSFTDRSSSWAVGAVFRWNVFSGFGDQARLAEAKAAVERARSERRRLEALVRMDLRDALARVREAKARVDVGRSIQAQAKESHRIVRDRYEAGLAGINDLLRSANAVLDADVQYTASTVDVVISAAMLERARGK